MARNLTPDQAVAALARANQQPPRIRTMPDHPALELTPLQQCVAALRVLTNTPGILAHLRAHDPMALEQAQRALHAAGYAAGVPEVIEAAPTRQEGPWTALRELDGAWTGLGPLDERRRSWVLWHRAGGGFQATPGTLASAEPPAEGVGLFGTVASLLKVKRLGEVKA